MAMTRRRTSRSALVAGALFCALVTIAGRASATPLQPASDAEVIEVLPAIKGSRAEERRLRSQLAQAPRDAALALTVARRHLDQAHELGDPRYAGMALAALAPWTDDATTPNELLLMRATLLQFLHQFDAAAASLQRLLARPGAARPQAWLTLATVRRVQGRYAESDAACAQVARSGESAYASACAAENAGLRGDVERARRSFTALLDDPRLSATMRAWIATSLAELEQRAGRAREADVAYRAASALAPDAYARLAYADFLIEQGRPAPVLSLLAHEPRSDAVLLRLAIAGTRAGASSAQGDVAEMRERISAANERPEARVLHGREQAMFALAIDGDAERALTLARGNVTRQREALDLLVLAQAARASGDAAARQEAQRVVREIGLRDRRVEALL